MICHSPPALHAAAPLRPSRRRARRAPPTRRALWPPGSLAGQRAARRSRRCPSTPRAAATLQHNRLRLRRTPPAAHPRRDARARRAVTAPGRAPRVRSPARAAARSPRRTNLRAAAGAAATLRPSIAARMVAMLRAPQRAMPAAGGWLQKVRSPDRTSRGDSIRPSAGRLAWGEITTGNEYSGTHGRVRGGAPQHPPGRLEKLRTDQAYSAVPRARRKR